MLILLDLTTFGVVISMSFLSSSISPLNYFVKKRVRQDQIEHRNNMIKKGLCETCGYRHDQLEDGFDYLDCMLFYRKHLEEKEIKEKRECKLEIWDPVLRVWKKKMTIISR